MNTTRETADHAELAIVAWAERGPESRELCDVQLFDALTDEEREAGWISEPLVTAAYAETLLSEIAALRGELSQSKREYRDDVGKHIARAAQAERQRDEAMGLLRESLAPGSFEGETKINARIRAFLANQGADQ